MSKHCFMLLVGRVFTFSLDWIGSLLGYNMEVSLFDYFSICCVWNKEWENYSPRRILSGVSKHAIKKMQFNVG